MGQRQPNVAISTSKAEYEALAHTAKAMQLRADLGLPCSTVTTQCNNHYIKDLIKDNRLKVA